MWEKGDLMPKREEGHVEDMDREKQSKKKKRMEEKFEKKGETRPRVISGGGGKSKPIGKKK